MVLLVNQHTVPVFTSPFLLMCELDNLDLGSIPLLKGEGLTKSKSQREHVDRVR